MNSLPPNSDESPVDNDVGIDLAQVVDFLSEHWKQAAVGAVAGALIGVGGWSMLASYKAETVLTNSNAAINFISWRVLQKNLPILAAQFHETAKGESVWGGLDSAAWWQKNVVPTYSLSKADAKDLVAISKELQDAEGQTILSLTITAQGSTKEKALSRLDDATRFIREGSAYLLLKNLVNGYEAKLLNSDADLQKKITDAEVELKFLRDRAQNLEALRQRFPSNVAVGGQQIVDLKDSNAKFMPISTQLVAVNTDINSTVESLKRMRDQQAQMKVLREFVVQATPLMVKESNGLKLADALLELEAAMRQQVNADDINAQQLLNEVRAEVVRIEARFTKGLEPGAAPYVSRPGPLMPVIGGLFGGAVLVLLLALGRKALHRLKPRSARVA